MKRERDDAVELALQLSFSPPTPKHREAESARIEGFLQQCIAKKQGGTLYVCGGPGTGKTLHVE